MSRWPDIHPSEEAAYWEDIRLGRRNADGSRVFPDHYFDDVGDEVQLAEMPGVDLELVRAVAEADAGRGR